MKKLEEALTEHWGERCPDHEPECPTCQAWGELDKLDKFLDERTEALRLLKTCRATLNMAGYYDLVQTIDNFLETQ